MVYGDDSVGRLQGTGPVYSMISSFMDLRLEERTFSLLSCVYAGRYSFFVPSCCPRASRGDVFGLVWRIYFSDGVHF